ncbi:Trp biosynthesis-associated membrane protein [Microbacterium sp. SLBN-146]|uniref:Trp biosynthesis-associated membrane protein n=1 Tax=Microbacterium sp. SLBN-146 TaxID=2768457 RepID=UPI001150170C|nr:Trp biosynthesis-associated membrane protein [Microbacterium sp. SLBN-146]TQJ32209.1 putative membrane protein (TIGR02234 family) [Microbacterium sp. SLBN-146]
MIRRARLLAILAILATGAIGTISSTQTWLTVSLGDGPHDALAVPGASAIPVLAPLSLAVLALGGALTIVGRVLRYVFGVLTLLIAGVLTVLTGAVVFTPQPSHVASVVTEATGITGRDAVAELVSALHSTPWPAVTLVAWIVLAAAGILTLATGHHWRSSGRRYSTDETGGSDRATSRPHDAIDDWDDLSRGQDPTA